MKVIRFQVNKSDSLEYDELNRTIKHGNLYYAARIDTTLQQKQYITNYKDFIDSIKKLENQKIINQIIVYRSVLNASEDNVAYLFAKRNILHSSFEEINYVFLYVPEKPEYCRLMDKLFNLSKNKTCRYFIKSSRNYYTLVAPWQVYDVLFTAERLKSEGTPLFTQFKKKCKNGKIRDIVAPNDDFKTSLQQLNLVLQRIYDRRNADFQVAYKKGKNIVANAKIHQNNNFVFNIDLHDFFPSCKRELVKKYIDFLFGSSYFNQDIEEYFLDLILIDDGLFIGSPISGTIANAILSRPAAYLHNMCNKTDMNFSIYADDMTFSSNRFIVKDYILELFNAAMQKYGLAEYFSLNSKKSIGFSSNNRKVTGVSINDKSQLTVNNQYYRDLRVKIHKLSIGEQYNLGALQKLRGKIAYALMVDESGKFYRYLKKFESTVRQYKLVSDKKFEALEEKFKGDANV